MFRQKKLDAINYRGIDISSKKKKKKKRSYNRTDGIVSKHQSTRSPVKLKKFKGFCLQTRIKINLFRRPPKTKTMN